MTVELFLHSYLKPLLQHSYPSLSPTLNKIIQSKLSASRDTSGFDCERILSKLLPFFESENEMREVFFQEFFNENSVSILKEYLSKLLLVCQTKWCPQFIHCIKTKKYNFHSCKTLFSIIDHFSEFLDLSPPSDLIPFYDEGGKEYLQQLKKENESSSPSSIVLPFSKEQFLKKQISFFQAKSYAIDYFKFLSSTVGINQKIYCKHIEKIENQDEITEGAKSLLIQLLVSITVEEKVELEKEHALSTQIELMLLEVFNTCEKWGEEVLIILCNPFPSSIEVILPIFQNLNQLEDPLIRKKVVSLLSDFNDHISFLEILEKLSDKDFPIEREDGNLDLLFQRLSGEDPNVLFPLPAKYLKKIRQECKIIQLLCVKWKYCSLPILASLSIKVQDEEGAFLKLAAIGLLAIYKKFGKKLHETQLITVLALNCYKKAAAQVKTGQGKTFINILHAFLLAKMNKRGAVLSSSSSLAKRDYYFALDFFKEFGISVSYLPDDSPNPGNSESQIFYGTGNAFKFAKMDEMVFSERFFYKVLDYIIVDELDNLMIDTFENTAYQSYPSETTYNWLYLPIFSFLKNNIDQHKSKNHFTDAIIRKLRSHLEVSLGSQFSSRLETISDQILLRLLQSANEAIFHHKEKIDYVVKSKKELDSKKSIIIVDVENTGNLKPRLRWSRGVHEFLEVKHDLTPQQESLMVLSLPHSVFYNSFEYIYGVSGTLGSRVDREEMKDIYGLETFDIPTAQLQLREDKPMRILETEDLAWELILSKVRQYREQGRPGLLTFKTIKATELASEFLKKNNIPCNLFNGIQDRPEEQVIKSIGIPKAVTVATNTAGRGIDPILTGEALKNGGLYIIVADFIPSLRSLEQIFGRAGRQGQPGSTEVILSKKHLTNFGFPSELLQQMTEESAITYIKARQIHISAEMRQRHKDKANIIRYYSSFVNEYFESLRLFREKFSNEEFLNKYASVLADRKILINRQLKNSNPDDQQLVQKILLTETSKQKFTEWKEILKHCGENIVAKSLRNWAILFFEETQLLCEREYSLLRAPRLLVQLNEEELEFERNEIMRDIKYKIKCLYHENKKMWTVYIDSTGQGIIQYLKDITGASFSDI